MPAIVRCPKCEHKLRVPDQLLGKRVKCPHCGQGFSTDEALVEESPPPSKGKDSLASSKRPASPPSPEKRNSERTPPEEASRRSSPAKREPIQDEFPLEERQELDEIDEIDEENGEDEGREEPPYQGEDEHEEEEEAPRPRRRSGNYARISKGLTFIVAGVLVSAISKVMLGIGAIVVVGMVGQGFASGTGKGLATGLFAGGISIIILAVLYVLSGLVNSGLWIAGEILCLKSPQKHSSKTLVTTCLILLSIGVAFSLCVQGAFFVEGQTSSSRLTATSSSSALETLARLFGGLASLATMAHFAVFMFYLRSLALNCQAQSLAKGIVYYLIALGSATVVMTLSCCIMIGLFFAGLGGMVATAQSSGQPGAGLTGLTGASALLGLACIGLWSLVALGFFIWYTVILIQVRRVVAERA